MKNTLEGLYHTLPCRIKNLFRRIKKGRVDNPPLLMIYF
jgi:hypothetical protein